MRLLKVKIICMAILSVTLCYAQDAMQHSSDTLPIITDTLVQISDTIVEPISEPPVEADSMMSESVVIISDTTKLPVTLVTTAFEPNPTRAVIYAAVFPGLGQIYNRKYWKLPIVYGGFLGFSYAISWNNRYYTDYSNGYKDIMGDDPEKDSWKNFLPYGADPETVDKEWLTDVMKRRKDYYRRYRDLSIIGTVAMYALSVIDAYVDAQLFDFNISSDLSLRVEPTVIKKTDYLANSVGFQCSISF
ncbi:MAG: hypothetical protein GX921_08840 [Bacteroidales bacterium]|nr:hypothetical protein [Bacteroidales bacterium]